MRTEQNIEVPVPPPVPIAGPSTPSQTPILVPAASHSSTQPPLQASQHVTFTFMMPLQDSPWLHSPSDAPSQPAASETPQEDFQWVFETLGTSRTSGAGHANSRTLSTPTYWNHDHKEMRYGGQWFHPKLYVRDLQSARLRSEIQQALIFCKVVSQELRINTIKEWDTAGCDSARSYMSRACNWCN